MDEMTVASVMTTNVVTAAPDTPFRELVAVVADYEVSAVPVIDRHGRLAGVVSRRDLLRVYLRDDAEPRARSRNCSSRPAPSKP